MRDPIICANDDCGAEVVMPVRDPEEETWLGVGASVYCSYACLLAVLNRRINAEGNQS